VSTQSASGVPESPSYISTGHLPSPELMVELVREAYQCLKNNTDSTNSEICPALARLSRDLFGICVAGTGDKVYSAGDADTNSLL
jgi:glutaminase